VNDALAKDEQTLAAWLGSRAGKWLFDRIRGVDDGFVSEHQRAKSISRDETFPEDIDDDAALDERLLELVDRATSDLRGNGRLARTVTVRLRDNDFTDRQASRTVRSPISSDRAVLAVARSLLGRLRMARRIPARLLGVAVSNLGEEEARSQLSLFEAEAGSVEETAKDRAVAQAIDHLRQRFGRDAIARGRTTD
jgi:DNA polymerase-4